MKRLLLTVIYSILLWPNPHSLMAQRQFDPQSIPVTRWVDANTKPISYDEYCATRNFAADAEFRLLRSGTVATTGLIDIIVNQYLYPQIESILNIYILDLQLEGYQVNLYTVLETQSAASLRNLLQYDWIQENIIGAILIGDLAVPWYEMDEPQSWGGDHVEFPCDLYLMDLDGTWGDADFDGRYDSHGGSMSADIWIGRLVPSRMTYHGATEVNTIKNYFRKNHDYRHGRLRLNDLAFSFVDDDWRIYGWNWDVAAAYPIADSAVSLDSTTKACYVNHVRELSNFRYEHILICSHSSAFAHYIVVGGNYQLFHNDEIETEKMQAHSYNLFACSNARYVELNNMGGWYIFESRYGLLSIGSTKTGSMLCFEDFYDPLSLGVTFGEAFLSWAQQNMETCAGNESRVWFYGMCLQGDPTLKAARFQENLFCRYLPGDINGDGILLGGDVTYGVRYFKGLGTQPPDSCLLDSTLNFLYVAGDINGNCEFRGSDITRLVQYFKGAADLNYCPLLPPQE